MPLRVYYDDQCEICQAGVSWLRLLDLRNRVQCLPLHSRPAELDLEDCLRELHVIDLDGRIYRGWNAVALLARQFPVTWLIGALGAIPPLSWLGGILYRFVAHNRYSLSKCRGGACRVSKLGELKRRASLGPFWTCYTLGLLLRLPLSVAALVRRICHNLSIFVRTYRRRIDLLDGRLSVCILNVLPCDLVTLLFGEQFVMYLYNGVAIDPGSTRMRTAVARHVDGRTIHTVVATHHHEEHACNLNWLSNRTGAPAYVSAATARLLQPPEKLPLIRAWMIGQQPPLDPPFEILGSRLGDLEVIPAPGHCDDHIVLYDPREKLLFAGDTFMGAYFSAPNPDVDSRKWIETLRRLVALDIEILIEGHGHIHTLRPEIGGPLVIRRSPREELEEKLRFFEWVREQVESGMAEGLPLRAIEMTCFPWGRAHSWEQWFSDELSRALSLGHWSRTELVRSFTRSPDDVLPTVYRARLWQ